MAFVRQSIMKSEHLVGGRPAWSCQHVPTRGICRRSSEWLAFQRRSEIFISVGLFGRSHRVKLDRWTSSMAALLNLPTLKVGDDVEGQWRG